MMREDSLEFLKAIVNVASPSGYEERAAGVFRRHTRKFADRVWTDLHGNVYAALQPDAPVRVMLAGHIDEIGFIVHLIDEDGLLYFSPIGDHDSVVAVGQRVWVHGKERVPGVIGRKAIHLLEHEEDLKRKPELHELWIDIGESTREGAEQVVELGDVVTFQPEFQLLRGGRATARGFDNKMGAFVVAEALRILREEGGLHPEVGVVAVGTVQEEIGYRGAMTAAFGLRPLTGLAVDVGHATDYPSVNRQRHGKVDLGKGPLITRGANVNPIVYRTLIETAREQEIPFQVEISADCTGTDATVMQTSRAGIATGLVSVPLRYMHTPCEVLALDDVENCARLMAAYCRRVNPSLDFTPREDYENPLAE